MKFIFLLVIVVVTLAHHLVWFDQAFANGMEKNEINRNATSS